MLGHAVCHMLFFHSQMMSELIHLVHLVNWVLVILDNFTIKSQEIFHRNENSHQNSIGLTKFIANVREKLRVDKKIPS